MNAACPCSLCGEGGHKASRCPALRDPLKDGFQSGGGGGGGHDHDEDDAVECGDVQEEAVDDC